MAAEKARAGTRTAKAGKSAGSSWTIRGVSKSTRDAVARAAKEDGVPVGKWIDQALSQAANQRQVGSQVASALHDLRSRAEPTIDQLRSRTDETLERWRHGLIEQLGSTLVSVQRLQKQLLGRDDEEESGSPKGSKTAKAAARPRRGATAAGSAGSNKAKGKGSSKPSEPGS